MNIRLFYGRNISLYGDYEGIFSGCYDASGWGGTLRCAHVHLPK